jgi:hypothetical protein
MARMDKKPVPFKATLFVCTNAREGKEACGNADKCGLALHAALKEEIKRRGLKGVVRAARSGCLDRCAQGPNVFSYPKGEWFSHVSLEDIPYLLSGL